MGDKAIITDILEASHLTDAYITVKPQDLLDLVHISSHSAAAEGETSVKYENFQEEEKQEGKERLSFGSTQIRSEGESTDSSDSESAGLLPFSKVSGRTAKFRSADTFTVDQAVDALGFGKFQLKLSFLTGLAWMADAMEMMILSILSPALKCDWWLESWQQALITTIVFCGMMLSSTMWGNINDRYGRKSGLVLCTSITFYFGLLSAFAPSYIWLLILRGLVGFGIGGVPQSVTLYAEFLPSTHRAKCVVLIEAFWAIGTCAEVLLALFVMPTLGWRWLLAFSAFPLLIFTMSCVWLPESARYHVASGQLDLAYATLERVAKENGKPMLLGKLVDVQNVNGVSETTKRGRMVDLFVPELRITTLLLWFIWFANAFSYYGIVLLTTELFQSGDSCHGGEADAIVIGEKPDCYLDCKQLGTKDYMDLLWTTLAEFPGLIITALIIEWLGRKKTMAIEFVIFSMFVYCLFACSTRTVVTIFIFIARAFISGAFQGAYVYTPEVYPTTTRAIGLGSCSMFARLGAIITPFVSQVAINTSVNIPIATYASVCLVAAVASLLLPIETKGREMKDSHKSH